jgi:hypothetical protein
VVKETPLAHPGVDVVVFDSAMMHQFGWVGRPRGEASRVHVPPSADTVIEGAVVVDQDSYLTSYYMIVVQVFDLKVVHGVGLAGGLDRHDVDRLPVGGAERVAGLQFADAERALVFDLERVVDRRGDLAGGGGHPPGCTGKINSPRRRSAATSAARCSSRPGSTFGRSTRHGWRPT